MKKIPVKIIAEAGVNHNGSIINAKKMIDIAVEAGADFVKFQTFKAENLVTKSADKADYQKKVGNRDETHYEMIKRLELNKSDHIELIKYCNNKNINFLSTAFDHYSIDLLAELDIPLYKIPSGDITNLPYLRHIGRIGKPIIMSTGMSTLKEVKAALDVLIESGILRNQITLLQCNTEYPSPIEDVNLKAMLTMRDEFELSVGYSDHTLGIEASIAAVAMGASIIEKHFTLDRGQSGPDHLASLEPNELKLMISSIRNIEKAIGNGLKVPSSSEEKNIIIARKSIVAKKSIKKGELFTKNNLTVKRPGSGMSPMEWDNLLGKKSNQNYNKDELIKSAGMT